MSYPAELIKKYWQEYKAKKASIEIVDKDVGDVSRSDFYIVKLDDRFIKYTRSNGLLEELPNDLSECSKYGIDSNKDCTNIIKECINDNIYSCFSAIARKARNKDFKYDTINPELALLMLHGLGFKAHRIDGKKMVINYNAWKTKIFDKLYDTLLTVSDETKAVLTGLVNYVNSHPELLNPELLPSAETLVDKDTGYNKYTKKPSPPVFPLVGLYDYNKKQPNLTTANTPKDLFGEIARFKGYQYGGSFTSTLEESKKNNDAIGAIITDIYNKHSTAIGYLQNNSKINLNESAFEVVSDANVALDNLKAYAEFYDKVKSVYDKFKYSKEPVGLNESDIDKLKEKLDEKIEEYKRKEKSLHTFFENIIAKNFSEETSFDL